MRKIVKLALKIKGLFLAAVAIFSILAGCGKKTVLDPRIGVIGSGDGLERVGRALANMGERFEALKTLEAPELDRYDLLILSRGTFSVSGEDVARRYKALLEYVHQGGSLLVFGLEEQGFRKEFLPYEVRFDTVDPSGWGNVDFSEEIALPGHPIFNSPYPLTYLAGLEEPSRISYTAPEWRILLAKDPRHPEFDAQLVKMENNVGSIFETGYGQGLILICQPIIERYHAGNAAIQPHPLEQGLLLFENLIEYMKRWKTRTRLPLVIAEASPARGPAGRTVSFQAKVTGSMDGSCAFRWEFGDGAESSEPAPEHKYSREGIYWATITVTNPDGAVDRDACRIEIGPRKTMRWADYLVEAQMHRYYPDAAEVGVNYRTALLLSGMLDVYERSRDQEILDYLGSFFQKRLVQKWSTRPYKGNYQHDINFLDIYSLMAPAYRLYRITGDSVYLEMAREVWEQSLEEDRRLPPGSLWGPLSWGGRKAIVDITYFEAELRSMYWENTGNIAPLDEAASQMILFTRYFQDSADSLFFQAIDLDVKDYFCSPERPNGLNDSKWGRANGWVALAFAELMPRLSATHPSREKIMKIVRTFFTGIVQAQDPETGLWAQVIDKLEYPGMWLETTSTSMFVYSLARLVETGILPRQPFLDCARRGYNGLQQRIKLGAFNYPYLSDACEGTMPRMNLTRWIEAHRHDNDYHVLGPFLRAEETVWRLAPPEVAVVGSLRPLESGLGPVLNQAGLYFYQIPSLFTAGDLDLFKAIFVDRGAFDRNNADIRAYYELLVEYAERGGTVIYFSQDDRQMLERALPEITFQRKEGETIIAEIGAGWEEICSGHEGFGRLVQKRYGKGKVIYGEDYPQPASLPSLLLSQ